jgi:hypothetical protein
MIMIHERCGNCSSSKTVPVYRNDIDGTLREAGGAARVDSYAYHCGSIGPDMMDHNSCLTMSNRAASVRYLIGELLVCSTGASFC